ncbi:Phosphatidylinositol 3,5-bisphosphate-binding protein [Coniosporium tulheliwenetii]|uniref:Phosphatidylinositol 3,5-bisphosphate-binding protein n=1 Tax=Coniosporium tulheliwenetii TaxID=3383036 RepID=A0ACC2ZEX1_9PEZI|nr:Phosphatidylinositol 3,5-bisphosphate-binding protein [Cladosporium sp. JES 115]
MNTRQAINERRRPVALSASFNTGASHFAVALESGYRIYDSADGKPVKERSIGSGVGSVAMLNTTRYLALVGGGQRPKSAPNKVVIWDDKQQTAAFLFTYPSHVHSIGQWETAANPCGLCHLGDRIIAFPGRTAGQVQIVHLATRAVSIIPAHTSPLRALALSPDGTLLATASDKGTILRVFATANCAKMHEFRRGIDPATIFSVAISPSSSLLAVTSDKSTLHIFELQPPARPAEVAPAGGRAVSPGHLGGSPNEWETVDAEQPAESRPRWGGLANIPMMPRVFSDTYSSASTRFEMGNEPALLNQAVSSSAYAQKPPKGIIGWRSDSELIVVGAGQDNRWERFRVGFGDDGQRVVFRDGWRRYLR